MANLPQKCRWVPDVHFSEPTLFILLWSPPSSLTQLLPVMILVWYQSTAWTLWSFFFFFYHMFSSRPFQRLPTCPLSSYKGLCSWGPLRRECVLQKGSRTVTRRAHESAHKVARETQQLSKAASSSICIQSWQQPTSVSSPLCWRQGGLNDRRGGWADFQMLWWEGSCFPTLWRAWESQVSPPLPPSLCNWKGGHFHIKIWLL